MSTTTQSSNSNQVSNQQAEIFINEEGNIYSKIFLLSRLPHNEFEQICKVNREMKLLCNKYIRDTANLTELLYRERSENLFSQEVVALKPMGVSWKDFYERIIYYTYEINDYGINKRITFSSDPKQFEFNIRMFLEAIEYGDIIGINYLMYKNPGFYNDLTQLYLDYELEYALNMGSERGNLNMEEWLQAKGVLPNVA